MLVNNYLTVIVNQYDAALSTINRCLEECNPQRWNEPLVNLSFSQAAFHALFYADLYLHQTFDDGTFEQQAFHVANSNAFRDYEELQDKKQEYHYDQQFVVDYLHFCREKMANEFSAANESWLLEPSPFPWIESTRSEVHIYNIRHIQHHAAQLIMGLRLDGQTDLPWFRSGWASRSSK